MKKIKSKLFAWELGVVLAVLEDDSELVINSLKHESFSSASFGHLI